MTIQIKQKVSIFEWSTCALDSESLQKCAGIENTSDALLFDEFINHPRVQVYTWTCIGLIFIFKAITEQCHLQEEVIFVNKALASIIQPKRKVRVS